MEQRQMWKDDCRSVASLSLLCRGKALNENKEISK